MANKVVAVRGRLLLKIIAFVGGIKSENILLLENLEIMEDYHHSNVNFFLSVVQKQHEVDFDVSEGIRQSGSIFCLVFELVSSFYSSDCPHHVYYVEVVLVQHSVDSFEFVGLGREVDSMLYNYV